MRSVAPLLVLLLAGSPPALTAQQDAPGAPPVTRARGRVRSDDDSATQLRRVRVTVEGETTATAFTDQEGRFDVARPVGPITLRFSKAGFAPEEIAGAAVADGGVEVRLARGAAIAGRAIDEKGAPVVDLPIRVRSVGPVANELPVSVATRTDDLGEFRIGSLPAGRYEAAVEDLSPRVVVNDAGGVSITSPRPPLATQTVTPSGAPLPAAPPPPPMTIRCDPATAACRDLFGRVEPERPEAAPIAVQLRAGEEGTITIVHEGVAAAVRAASEFSAGFAAGVEAAANAGTAASRARGTAVIAGVVTSPDGRPVPGAVARLTPATAGGPFGVVASSSSGAFEFTGVAPGSYRLEALLNGFLIGEHGQARPGQPGNVLTVRDGQRVDHADVMLHRGPVVAGTVTDGAGEPIEGLSMQVWRATSVGGRPGAETVANLPPRTTDDRGRYRIYGLQPGAYYIVASEAGTASEGNARASGVRAAPRAFYPAAPTLAQATPVRVDVGLDATGSDIMFVPAPTFRLSGIALDSDGDPITWPVTLTVSAASGAVMMPPISAPYAFDGSFEFTHVPPGRYVLQAFQMATREFGRAFVDVIDGDVGPVRLNVAPTSTISGRILVDGARAHAALGDVRIDVLAADPDYLSQNALPRAAVFMLNTRTDSTGSIEATYEMRGLAGPVRFVDVRAPAGWWLESVSIGGVNAADDPVLFEATVDSRSDVEIVFSTNGAEVSGRAVDGGKEPAPRYVAVAFPVDRARWYPGSRYVKSARPAGQSRFTLASLPPGEYWVAAVEALPDGALRDPGVLEALAAIGRRVTISAGERLAIDLPLARLPAR